MAGRQDLPVGPDRLHQLDLDLFVLVVPDLDLPLALGRAVADHVEVHLPAIADDVERFAHLDPHPLVAGCVIDPILADELLGP